MTCSAGQTSWCAFLSQTASTQQIILKSDRGGETTANIFTGPAKRDLTSGQPDLLKELIPRFARVQWPGVVGGCCATMNR